MTPPFLFEIMEKEIPTYGAIAVLQSPPVLTSSSHRFHGAAGKIQRVSGTIF
jgi:hypothetical protein